MTLCNLAYPPTNCIELVWYLLETTDLLEAVNPIRTGTDDHAPSDAELNALWGDCDPPIGAVVYWYDTNAAEASQWVTHDGTTWEQML